MWVTTTIEPGPHLWARTHLHLGGQGWVCVFPLQACQLSFRGCHHDFLVVHHLHQEGHHVFVGCQQRFLALLELCN